MVVAHNSLGTLATAPPSPLLLSPPPLGASRAAVVRQTDASSCPCSFGNAATTTSALCLSHHVVSKRQCRACRSIMGPSSLLGKGQQGSWRQLQVFGSAFSREMQPTLLKADVPARGCNALKPTEPGRHSEARFPWDQARAAQGSVEAVTPKATRRSTDPLLPAGAPSGRNFGRPGRSLALRLPFFHQRFVRHPSLGVFVVAAVAAGAGDAARVARTLLCAALGFGHPTRETVAQAVVRLQCSGGSCGLWADLRHTAAALAATSFATLQPPGGDRHGHFHGLCGPVHCHCQHLAALSH